MGRTSASHQTTRPIYFGHSLDISYPQEILNNRMKSNCARMLHSAPTLRLNARSPIAHAPSYRSGLQVKISIIKFFVSIVHAEGYGPSY